LTARLLKSSMPVSKLPYPDYKLKSGWNALLPARAPNPKLAEKIEVDVAIVGAGFTGISAAKRWRELQPDATIALLDSSEIGEGNPGRNSGFLLEISLAEDADAKNIAKMAVSNKLISETMQHIVSEVQKSGMDCDIKRAGTYRAAASDTGNRSLKKYQAFLEATKTPFEELDKNELKQRLGTSFYQAGLYSPHCYLVQPASVIRALATSLPNDINLFENTAALNLTENKNGWTIKTAHGSIQSKKVVLANNAFSKDLGIGKSCLAAMYTYAGLTPQLEPGLLECLGSDKNWGLLPTHRLGSTLRRTADGRLLIRSHYGYEAESSINVIRAKLHSRMQTRFPQLDQIVFEQIWGGAVGFTFNGGALWGEAKPDLFVSAGCNGGGTVKGTLLGRLLADLANGKEVPNVAKLFGKASWMPPDPFRALGFHLASLLESIQGHKEL
jgi:glycine/D-amino acid oxidase-like deaminating enzyme